MVFPLIWFLMPNVGFELNCKGEPPMSILPQCVRAQKRTCGSDGNPTIIVRFTDVLDRLAERAIAEENPVQLVRSALVLKQLRGSSGIECSSSRTIVLLANVSLGFTVRAIQEKDAVPFIRSAFIVR